MARGNFSEMGPAATAKPPQRLGRLKKEAAGSKARSLPSARPAKTAPGFAYFHGYSEMLLAVEAGVPLEAIANFVSSSGVELKDIHDIVIPARTLKHRRSRNEPLSRDESDKLARLMRIFNQSLSVFGDVEKARNWLYKPKKRFEDQTPLRMLRTELGGRMVEEMLGQIDDGMFA